MKVKNIFSFIMVLALVLTCLVPTTVKANEALVSENLIVQPDTITACAYGNGIHQMKRNGVGSVFVNGVLKIYAKPFWQCTNCYLGMCTSGDPGVGDIVGEYATAAYSEWITSVGTQIYAPYTNYHGSSRLEGFRFFYSS
ncbi:MAG: hypothetical protein AB7E31_11960 [Desulfitobacterium sp.]